MGRVVRQLGARALHPHQRPFIDLARDQAWDVGDGDNMETGMQHIRPQRPSNYQSVRLKVLVNSCKGCVKRSGDINCTS